MYYESLTGKNWLSLALALSFGQPAEEVHSPGIAAVLDRHCPPEIVVLLPASLGLVAEPFRKDSLFQVSVANVVTQPAASFVYHRTQAEASCISLDAVRISSADHFPVALVQS